jgi:hypothetical protein
MKSDRQKKYEELNMIFNKVMIGGSNTVDYGNLFQVFIKKTAKKIDAFVPSSILRSYIDTNLLHEGWDTVAPNIVKNIDETTRIASSVLNDPNIKQSLKRAFSMYGKAMNEISIITREGWDTVSPNIVKNIEESARIVSLAVNDRRIRKAVEKAMVIYGKALTELYDISEPTILEITDKFWNTVNKMSIKSSSSATNAMIGSISAVLAEIPVVGGVVDIIIASGKWYNAIASGMVAPSIELTGEVTNKAIKAKRDFDTIKNKHEKEIQDVTDEIKTEVSRLQKGGFIPNLKNKKNKTTKKRITKSIHTFTQRASFYP